MEGKAPQNSPRHKERDVEGPRCPLVIRKV